MRVAGSPADSQEYFPRPLARACLLRRAPGRAPGTSCSHRPEYASFLQDLWLWLDMKPKRTALDAAASRFTMESFDHPFRILATAFLFQCYFPHRNESDGS